MTTRHELAKIHAAAKGRWEIKREEDPYADDFPPGDGLTFPEWVGPFWIEHDGSVDQIEADAAVVIADHNCAPRLLELLDVAATVLEAIADRLPAGCESEGVVRTLLTAINGPLDE